MKNNETHVCKIILNLYKNNIKNSCDQVVMQEYLLMQ